MAPLARPPRASAAPAPPLRLGHPEGAREAEADRAAKGARPSSSGAAHDAAPLRPDLARALGAVEGGEPLPHEVRARHEAALGHDLSRVRIHHDAQADALARRLHARAFAWGGRVAFRRGEYCPGAPEGDRLLAHELAHVAQAEPGVVRRTPGVDARESWAALVRQPFDLDPEEPARRGRAQDAINRMLQLPEGAQLVNRLFTMLMWERAGRGRPRRMRTRPRVLVSFEDRLRGGHEVGADGYFEPREVDADPYTVHVKNQAPAGGGDPRVIRLGSQWPGSGSANFAYSHVDPESEMATTLFHELLHVWFVNRPGTVVTMDGPETGHGDVLQGDIDPEFYAPLRQFYREMDALEAQIHARAAEERRRREEAAGAAERARAPPEAPRAQPRREEGPSIVGGEASAHGGVVSLGGTRATVIVGADLILERIASLRVGARGVYMTPEHLLAGGTVGLRLLQDEGGTGRPGGRVENPLFFDVEAGILAEVSPGSAARLTNGLAGMASVGVGQEYGREGARFLWRLGGFVLVTDRREVAAGATLGAGVRF